LREENQNQNKDITTLQDTIQLQNKTIIQHEITIKELDQEIRKSCNGCKHNHDSSEKHEQSKRPARLLPLQLLFDQDEDDDTTKKPPPRKFYGPPTNCSDLSRLGYTLNGYYLVRNSYTDTMTNNHFNSTYINNVDTVYCAFKQEGMFSASLLEHKLALPPHILELKEQMAQLRQMVKLPHSSESYIGNLAKVYVNLNIYTNTNISYHLFKKGTPYTSTVICFAVQKIIFNQPTESSVVQFEEEVINIGETFDFKESVFVAPKDGVYEFIFNGYKRGFNKEHVLKVSLRLNGKAVVNALAEELVGKHRSGPDIDHNFHCPISMHSLLKLNKGDRIELFKNQGNLHVHDLHRPFHFSGKLLFTEDDKNPNQKPPVAVYFVVQKKTGFNTTKSVIPFEVESLNEVRAFNMKKNAFIAPVSGIYEFTLKGYKTVIDESLEISLRLNGKAIANSWTDWINYHHHHSPISINTILQVKQSDVVDLYLRKGQIYDTNDYHYTTFTGKLLVMNNQTKNYFGSTNFHSSAVFFNVQKTTEFSNRYEVVPFEKEVLNIGKAFNMSEKTFIAPREGIYEFSFFGLKTGDDAETFSMALRLNGKSVTYASADAPLNHGFHTPSSFHSILKMRKGDRVDLYLEMGVLYDSPDQYTHFTGKLIFAVDKKK